MIVVDSSGWIEFFTDGPLADDYARRLRNLSSIVTPIIVIYEVYKWLKREVSESDGIIAVSAMQRTQIIPVDMNLASQQPISVSSTASQWPTRWSSPPRGNSKPSW